MDDYYSDLFSAYSTDEEIARSDFEVTSEEPDVLEFPEDSDPTPDEVVTHDYDFTRDYTSLLRNYDIATPPFRANDRDLLGAGRAEKTPISQAQNNREEAQSQREKVGALPAFDFKSLATIGALLGFVVLSAKL